MSDEFILQAGRDFRTTTVNTHTNSTGTGKMEIRTSDLFLKRGRSFDFAERIRDQNLLIERIHTANKDILNPNAIAITHVAEELKEFSTDHITSIVFIEHIFDKLTDLDVSLV